MKAIFTNFMKCFFLLILLHIAPTVNAQWDATPSGLTGNLLGILEFEPIDENTIWAIPYNFTGYNTLLKSVDGGVNWEEYVVPVQSGFVFSSITALDADKAWVVMWKGGTQGAVFKTTDGGLSWEEQPTAFPASGSFPTVIHFWDEDNGVCVGDIKDGYMEIYTTDNGGVQWTRVSEDNVPAPIGGETGVIISNFDVKGNTIWLPTIKGRIFRSDDFGNTWTASMPVFSGIGATVAFADSLNGMAATYTDNPGAVVNMAKTEDGGMSWSLLPTENLPPIAGPIAYVPGTNEAYVMVGQGAFGLPPGTVCTTDGGASWEVIDLEIGHNFPTFISPTAGWVGGVNGDLNIYSWTGELCTSSTEVIARFSSDIITSAFPNPFEESISIQYELPVPKAVNISIYDLNGGMVQQLERGKKTSGKYTVSWRPSNEILPGIYLCTINAGNTYQTFRIVYID